MFEAPEKEITFQEQTAYSFGASWVGFLLSIIPLWPHFSSGRGSVIEKTISLMLLGMFLLPNTIANRLGKTFTQEDIQALAHPAAWFLITWIILFAAFRWRKMQPWFHTLWQSGVFAIAGCLLCYLSLIFLTTLFLFVF